MKFNQSWQGFLCDKDGVCLEKFNATVPGNIQMDYARHKDWLDTLQFSTNAKKFEAYTENFWKYETELDFEKESDEKIYFVAEGIDYEFDVLLNGERLIHGEGMYTPVEINITELAKKGDRLQVLIYPHPFEPSEFPKSRCDARQSCKPPVCYGWDWNPYLLISGLWKPAYIETRKSDYINNCELFYDLDLETKTVTARFEAECSAEITYTVADREGRVVYEGKSPEFTLKDVNLWWCNGQGEPYLYSWSAKTESHSVCGQVGFRTVSLVKNIGTNWEPDGFPKSRYPAPITVLLNGRRIFAKGSNWVNPELFFGAVTKERYCELVTLAKEANMNIFRIWGGSGICKNEFYEECDRQGIMVWQEFMLACNNYEGTPHYLAVLEKEATSIIKALRRYTSIILWCGGNELFNGWSGMDDQSLPLRLLNSLCYRLDPKRPFLMTSPLTGMAHGGYIFRYEGVNGNKDVFEIFNNTHQTAYTEFGVPSIADEESLKKIIPENELFPIEKTDSWIYHHAFEAWGKEKWACLYMLEHYFGKPTCLKDVCEQSSWLQCSGYQYIFEEARRQWPYCSMAINWCYDEPWITAAGNSLIAYPSKPTPAYYAVKNALRSKIPTARIGKFDWKNGEIFRAELWYINDSQEVAEDTVTASIIIGDKEYELLTWNTGELAADSKKIGPSINFTLPVIFHQNKLILKLKSKYSDRCNEYNLLYRCTVPPPKTLQLNV